MIRVVVDDVAFVAADAIVRPATASLEPTARALRRLEQVGGEPFWKQLNVQHELATGSAVVTGGGDLPSEFVIHVIISSPGEPVSTATVRQALTSAIQRATDWQLAHLVIPPLGTGAGNLSIEDAAAVMIAVLDETLGRARFPTQVTLVVETEEDKQVFESYVGRMSR